MLTLKPLKLSTRRKYLIKKMEKDIQKRYLATMYGLNTARISKKKYWNFIDNKSKEKSGRFLKMYNEKMKLLYNCTNFKKPTFSADDWVGIEIECFIPKSKIELVGTNCECFDSCECDEDDCSCECECVGDNINSIASALSNEKIEGVQVASDGSLGDMSGDYIPVEIKILTRISDMRNLRKLCTWMEKTRAKVNNTCGLHVHLDIKNISDDQADSFYNNLEQCLPFLFLMVPDSRKENRYCKNQASRSDRYSAINGTSIEKHGTIEVRLHSGTTDFQKISNWIILLQEIKNKSNKYDMEVNKENKYNMVEKMLAILSLPYSTNYYILNRIIKFNPSLFTDKLDMSEIEQYEEIA